MGKDRSEGCNNTAPLPEHFQPKEGYLWMGTGLRVKGTGTSRTGFNTESGSMPNTAEPSIIGNSQNLKNIKEIINHVASTTLNVVITGETGVGKELIAQSLYFKSNRNGKPFIKVNCAALPEGLLESELFGYERGAFTGAERKRRGKFELSHSGVLFMDEIGDMSFHLQAKLLQVLQSGEFSPLGSEKSFRTDTWVIAATNNNLEEAIRNQTFREDLYYRLNIVNIHIDPLRDRPEDIPLLVEYFSKRYQQQYGKQNYIAPDENTMEKLMAYPWPGNVRELQNYIKKVIVLGDWNAVFQSMALIGNPNEVTAGTRACPKPAESILAEFVDLNQNGSLPSELPLKKIRKAATDRVEKEVIAYVLGNVGWNRTRASKILKISYKTLLYKIEELGIVPPEAGGGGASDKK